MECEKVRDRFSSLLEGDLNPLEEEVVREHLASCSECQKDLERFEKTMRWLHSVGEVEVPDGFLSGIYKKMEDRKEGIPVREKVRPTWFHYPLSMKLPIQAMAMVAVVFIVFYLTKMMPVESPHPKGVDRAKVPHSEAKKMEVELISKEMKKEGVTEKPPLETPQQTIPSEPGKIKEGLIAKEKAYLAAKPPKEIVLRISDRDKVVSNLHELIKQFGGEIISAEGNILLASLPIESFSDFERGLIGLNSSLKADKMIPQKETAESLSVSPGVKRREFEEKDKEPAFTTIKREDRINIRILLLQE
jgi:hypothetical protein